MKRGAAFVRDLAEIGGFDADDIPSLGNPPDPRELPRYVPMVQHGRVLADELYVPWAAIPLKEVFRFKQGRYSTLARTPLDLRRLFALGPRTRILFVGTGPDAVIERFWQYRRLHDAPKQLAELEIRAAVVPNYSFCLEDPRPQHLFNRKRSLICAREMAAAGLRVVPYLQALTPTDWTFWSRFLRQHSEITVVAKEFQTGLARPERGVAAIRSLQQLETEIGRQLHVVAIGGARYARDLAASFASWTVVDSIPFMKAIKRRVAQPGPSRIQWRPALGEAPERLLDHNILAYEQWLSRTAGAEES
jgi:hypothetical protein